ncbi:MAG: hypothetical protein AB1714_27705 [Acidobacteriota bacterium]
MSELMQIWVFFAILLAPSIVAAESTFQQVAECVAAEVAEGMPASESRARMCVLPCRNLGGLDVPALQQLGQVLQSELAKRAGEKVSLTAVLSTLDVENPAPDLTPPVPVDYWLEPAVAYDGANLVVSAKLFSSDSTLERFAVCSRPIGTAEILLFSQPPPSVPGVGVEQVFESHPLPFHAVDIAVRRGSGEGVTELAFLGTSEILLFELRHGTLVMKDRLSLPRPELESRDARGSIWWGVLGGKTMLLAQRSSEPIVHAFEASGETWAPTQAPLQFVPFDGSSEGTIAGASWKPGRNYFAELQSSSAKAGSQTQPLPPHDNEPWYAGAIVSPDAAHRGKIVVVGRDSMLCIMTMDGKKLLALSHQVGDAFVATTVGGQPAVVASLPGVGNDGLRAIRLDDGVVLFETEMPAKRVESVRILDGRLFVLTESASGVQTIQILELTGVGQAGEATSVEAVQPEGGHR